MRWHLLFIGIFSFTGLLKSQSPAKIELCLLPSASGNTNSLQTLAFGSYVTAQKDIGIIRIIKLNDTFSGTYFLSVFDMQPDGVITQLMPNKKIAWDKEPVLHNYSDDTLTFFNFPIRFSPPYGKENLILLCTRFPIGLSEIASRGEGALTQADFRWLLQGNTSYKLGNDYHISNFSYEIRPESAPQKLKPNNGNKNNGDDGELDQNQFLLQKTKDKIEAIEEANRRNKQQSNGTDRGGSTLKKTIVVNRFEVPKDEIYIKYPVLTMIEPNEPSYTGERGVKLTLNPSKFLSTIVKGTISCRQATKMVEIWVQSAGKSAVRYQVTEFKQAPQSVFFEKQIELNEGNNLIEVTAITEEGYAVVQQFEMIADPEKTISPGKNILVCLAVNNYSQWPALKNPVSDAEAVYQTLTRHYGFDSSNSYKLYNQNFTRRKVDSLFWMLIQQAGENDRILVYYAGHGYYSDKMKQGYWIPCNGPALNSGFSEYIDNSMVANYIKALNTRHTLFITDACFSGSYFTDEKRGAENYTDKLGKFRSRWVFSSGRMETVSDEYNNSGHSPFAYYLLKYLNQPAANSFTISDLATYVTKSVGNNGTQLPMARSIQNAGDEGGEFIFEFR